MMDLLLEHEDGLSVRIDTDDLRAFVEAAEKVRYMLLEVQAVFAMLEIDLVDFNDTKASQLAAIAALAGCALERVAWKEGDTLETFYTDLSRFMKEADERRLAKEETDHAA